MRSAARALAVVVPSALLAFGLAACGTVTLGDNISPPDLQLNEDFFYCVVQPQVIAANRCASGGMGEAGTCHSSRSAMRLLVAAETDPPPTCDAMNHVTSAGSVPASYRQNLDAIRPEVQSDSLSSPIYRRPTKLDSHPRLIFMPTDPPAMIIDMWLSMGAT